MQTIRLFKSAIYIVLVMSASFTSSTVSAATSAKCPNEKGYFYTNDRNSRNPRAGGFVSNSALVGDYVFIAPTAAVCGSASVLEFARVYGEAVVYGEAEVTDKARVYGKARVGGTAFIAGTAKVSDHADVSGDAIVDGKAWLRGYKKVSSGHFNDGVYTAQKPQSVINQENKLAAEKQRLEQQRREREQKAQLEAEAVDSLNRVARKLARGGHTWGNRNRRVKWVVSWSVYDQDPKGCWVELERNEKEYGMDSGQFRDEDTSFHKVNLRSYSFQRTGESYSPRYCMIEQAYGYDQKATFCFNSSSDLNSVFSSMSNHHNKYCR